MKLFYMGTKGPIKLLEYDDPENLIAKEDEIGYHIYYHDTKLATFANKGCRDNELAKLQNKYSVDINHELQIWPARD